MKATYKLWAFCVVLFLANLTSVTGQKKAEDKTTEKNISAKSAIQTTTNVNTLDMQVAANDSIKPYKNLTGEIYRIGFKDKLQVDVDRHPELSQSVNISPDGTIRLFRIDKPIVAVCKTEEELRDSIRDHYKSYLKRPEVKVSTIEKRTKSYGVIGAVQKPGIFYYDNKISLLELLSLASGPNVEFAGSKIQIARIGATNGCVSNSEETTEQKIEFIGYNLNDVMQGKSNPLMQPGDIVSVLIAEEAYIVGNVLKPTKIQLNEPKTLMQAIAAAGGVDSTANTDKVIIQRHESNSGKKVELVYNLKDIRDRKIPDPQIQANDIIQVSNDKIKSVRKGITDIFKSTVPTIIRGY
ncbi:MAG TPA: polysaccharide biosynthesis/export family protein [Pyrinomonadaceae bacterium]|jgi:protein involved in polysaccharide export with SLBB domain